MTVERSNTIVVQGSFIKDGYSHVPEMDPITYPDSFVNASMDFVIDPETADSVFDLSHFGTIARLFIRARSGTMFYKLNGSTERYPLNALAILTQAPTQLKFDNDDETSTGIVEISVIGTTT